MAESETVENPNEGEAEDQNDAPIVHNRAFTLKSVLFGAIGLLFTIFFTAINDIYLVQTSFIANHLPPGPLFLVIALALIWNPMWYSKVALWTCGSAFALLVGCYTHFILGHSFFWSWHLLILLFCALSSAGPVWEFVSKKFALTGKELITTLIIIICGCWTAGASLNYHFAPTQVGMWTIYNNKVQMQKMETIEYIPEHLFPSGGLNQIGDDEAEKQRVYEAWRTGSAEQGTEGVPWDAWMPSIISSWAPLFIFFSTCTIALALIVHRQWSHHEQLAYPIAEIGTSIFSKEEGRALPSLFYNKQFWIASLFVIAFHGIRYMHTWFPNNVPDIQNRTYFNFMLEIFPVLRKSGVFYVHYFQFFFTIIGICYFLSREIGLTLGVAPFLLAFVGAQFYITTGQKISGDDTALMRTGAYIAYAAIILYTGRNYYWAVLKKAFNFKPASAHEQDGAFASRILMVSFLGLILVLNQSFNLDLVLSILFCVTGLLMFLVFTRVICETGLPYLQSAWEPGPFLIKFFGVSALGATPVVLLYYISAIVFADPKETVMPYVANSLKMAENNKFKLKKIIVAVIVISMVSVLMTMGVRLYQQYHMGGHKMSYPWADYNVPHGVLSNATRDLTTLDDIGQRTAPGEASSVGFFERIGLIDTSGKTIGFLLAGVCGVGLFFFLRFRFTGFFLHPVLFLIWGTGPNQRTFYSFLIGWLIREAIVRFGGGKIYQDCKPFFIGLIFAELLMAVIGMGVGTLYCLFTEFQEKPPKFAFQLG